MDDNTDNGKTGFCNGMSMTMSMSGFQSALTSPADCLTYLFRNWKLDSVGKFQGAMIYTFLLAVLCEGMSYSQSKIRNLPAFQSKRMLRKLVMTFLYGLQQCLGWALMLISMMFSLELFACVIAGVLIGKIIFPTEQLQQQYVRGRFVNAATNDGRLRRQRSTDGVTQVPEGDTPNSTRQEGMPGSSTFRRRRR